MSDSKNAEQQDQGGTRPKMNKRPTKKEDGRSLIYYTFGSSNDVNQQGSADPAQTAAKRTAERPSRSTSEGAK